MRRGFTLIELLVTMGFVVALSFIGILLLTSRKNVTDLTTTTQEIGSTLRNAQSRSVTQASSTQWGVHFDNTSTTAPFYALFATAYGSSTNQGILRLPKTVTFATSSPPAAGSSFDVTFSQITGLPSTSTTVILNGFNNATASVSVASGGLITF